MGATNLIPGPNAVEIAIHLGLIRAGWMGFLAAGSSFILPGMLITMVFAWLYARFGGLPQVSWILYGIKPVIIAIILQALLSLGRRAFRGIILVVAGVSALILHFLGFDEILVLFGSAAVVLAIESRRHILRKGELVFIPFLFGIPFIFYNALVSFTNGTLFMICFKIGALLYGSGYVLFAFARAEFVEKLGWITDTVLVDAIAAGQAAPGPIVQSITFIGYILGGIPSAVIATVGVFLPSFLLVALISRIVILVRKTWWAASFVDGVNVASLGLMAAVTIELTGTAIIDPFTFVLALVSLVFTFRYKISSVWIITGGGVLGVAYKLIVG